MRRLGVPLFITRHVLIALVVGGIGGLTFAGFLLEFDRFTSRNAFCTACHSMTYAETAYQRS